MTNVISEVLLCIVPGRKYVFVSCPEQADVKQVCEGGMLVCLETLARLSGGVSPEPINQRLVDRREPSPSPSDNGGEDIVFAAKILPEPGAGSHYCLVILFQY